jgi:hypothetical protein
MGPIELQLCRELAIYLVRACTQFDAGAANDLAALQAQFERWTDQWLSLSRVELDGLSPEQVILAERLNRGHSPDGQWAAPVLRVELYTDLPEAASRPLPSERPGPLADAAPPPTAAELSADRFLASLGGPAGDLPTELASPGTTELTDELASRVAADFSLQAAEIERMLDLFDGLNPRRLADDLSGIPQEEMALDTPLDAQRWQEFYQRYLRDWPTDDRLP